MAILCNKAERILELDAARFSRIWGERAFDRAGIQHLDDEADIFHCVRPVVPETIEAAGQLGIVTTARSATCHARFNKEMMDIEREKYGLPCINTYCDEARVQRIERVYEHLDWIITWYDTVAQTYVNYGVPREKIRVLGIPSGFRRPVEREWASGGPLRVLYVAHTSLLKGLHYLLGAWESHAFHKIGCLTICGAVDANIRRIIKRKGWSLRNVEFVGYVDTDVYYRRANVLVLPSLSEGDPAVLREAMAYGIPVIVTENCGAKEVVERFETGIVIPVRSEQAIAEAITRLHKSSELRHYLGCNGQKIAEEFTWQRYAQRLFEEFERLMRERQGRSG